MDSAPMYWTCAINILQFSFLPIADECTCLTMNLKIKSNKYFEFIHITVTIYLFVIQGFDI